MDEAMSINEEVSSRGLAKESFVTVIENEDGKEINVSLPKYKSLQWLKYDSISMNSKVFSFLLSKEDEKLME